MSSSPRTAGSITREARARAREQARPLPGVTLAVVGMVIAEFFTTISGLGAVIINSANNFDTATMFVPIIILMLMAIGLNWLIGFVERRMAPWQAEISGRDRE